MKKKTNASSEASRRGKKRASRKWLTAFSLLALLVCFALAPFAAKARSAAILYPYDFLCEQKSLPHDLGLRVRMPLRDAGFYPLSITYSDDAGMSAWLGEPVRFTVDYAVADYRFCADHSEFYERESPLYGAYVGAYYLQGLHRAADEQTVLNITAFDQRCLALPALGLPAAQAVFRVADSRKCAQRFTIGGLAFERYDAAIETNGPDHVQKGFATGDILFGSPPPTNENYPLRPMTGRIYVAYVDDLDLTLGLYILAKEERVVEQIDRIVLSRASIALPPSRTAQP